MDTAVCCGSTVSSASNHYWRTLSPKNREYIDRGNNVYHLLENFDVVDAYVREEKSLIPDTPLAGKTLQKNRW